MEICLNFPEREYAPDIPATTGMQTAELSYFLSHIQLVIQRFSSVPSDRISTYSL